MPQIVFVHVPKTAGLSLARAIEAAVPGKSLLVSNHNYKQFEGMGSADMAEYAFIGGHIWYSTFAGRINSDTVLISVLRDPVERLLSAWRYIVGQPLHPEYSQTVGLSFPEWLRRDAERIRSHACRQLTGHPDALAACDILRERYALVGVLPFYSSFVGRLRELTGLNIEERRENSHRFNIDVALDCHAIDLLQDITRQDRMLYNFAHARADEATTQSAA